MKKGIFLDSSFFFPFINVEVENCEKSDILNLLKNEKFQIVRSELTTFELSAKGVKLVNEGKIDITDLIKGINTVQFLSTVNVIPIYYSDIQIMASQFRSEHSDFIDCLILSSAINYSDQLITFDLTLKKKFNEKWKQNLTSSRLNFEMVLWEDFKNLI